MNSETQTETKIKTKSKSKSKIKKVLRKCIGKDEFKFLLNKIDECEKDPVNQFSLKLLNVILYYTGLRLNEALSLTQKNVKELMEKGKLRVYCKKTKDYRWLYLHEDMRNSFLSHFEDGKTYERMDDKEGIVCNSKKRMVQRKLTEREAARLMDPYFDILEQEFGGSVAGLNGRAWGTHSYRINFINNVIRSADVDQASKLIGHRM